MRSYTDLKRLLHSMPIGEPPRKRRRIGEENDIAFDKDGGLVQDMMDIDNPFGMEDGFDLGGHHREFSYLFVDYSLTKVLTKIDDAMDSRMRSSEVSSHLCLDF